MITTYSSQNHLIAKSADGAIDESTIWIDLIDVLPEEVTLIDNVLGINIPSSEDAMQIEVSERLYLENDALYLTVTQLVHSKISFPETHPIVFILHQNRLLTVRYIDTISSDQCVNRLLQEKTKNYAANDILLRLLRDIVTKLADIVQTITIEIDEYGRIIYAKIAPGSEPVDYRAILEQIGHKSELLSKSRESLFSLTMAAQYALKSSIFTQDVSNRDLLNTLLTDIASIIDFSQFISNELERTLDATLGMIAIEQNNIIKIFSVATIFFLPPTLIASIYGMNFELMPELKHPYGYPLVLLVMILTILSTYKYFKKRKWL